MPAVKLQQTNKHVTTEGDRWRVLIDKCTQVDLTGSPSKYSLFVSFMIKTAVRCQQKWTATHAVHTSGYWYWIATLGLQN